MHRFAVCLLLPLLLLPVCTACFAQQVEIRPVVKKLVRQMQLKNIYEIGPGSRFGGKYLTLSDQLADTATNGELLKLTSYHNAVVRVYAFEALSVRKYPALLSIILQHLHDAASLKYHVMGSEFVHSASGRSNVNEEFTSCYALSPTDRQTLDSILIFSKHHFACLGYKLQDLAPRDIYYNRIRELVESNVYPGGVRALAKFKNTADLAIIEKSLKTWKYLYLEAVEDFPDPYFKTMLYSLGKGDYPPYGFCTAAAVYRDTFAYNRLMNVLNKPRANDYMKKETAKEVYKAVNKYRCPLFDSISFTLWRNYYFIDAGTLRYLDGVDRKKTLQLALESLHNPDKPEWSYLLLDSLLNYVIANDSNAAREVINEQVRKAYVLQFQPFAGYARAFKDTGTTNSLLYRLGKTDNAYVYMPIVETILSYNNKELNKKMVEIINGSKDINDWGKERVVKMLANAGISL